MRLKLDGELFQQKELEELLQQLEKEGISIQAMKKGRVNHKGMPDGAEIISWIVIIADAFLPMVVDCMYNYIKNHKKEKAVIDIEQREPDGQQTKVTISTDKEISSMDIQTKENGDIHIFVTKK